MAELLGEVLVSQRADDVMVEVFGPLDWVFGEIELAWRESMEQITSYDAPLASLLSSWERRGQTAVPLRRQRRVA